MIKKFSEGDISVRPFKTFKNWNVQSADPYAVDSFGRNTYIDNNCEINRGVYVDPNIPIGPSDAINPSGKYERVVYSTIDAMFYENAGDALKTFGVEQDGVDVLTGKQEVRNLNGSLTSLRLFLNRWGEKVRPTSVKIVDNSNIHAQYKIFDDGYTNLYVSGSHFSSQNDLLGYKSQPPMFYWNTGSGQYFYNSQSISLDVAREYMNMGFDVTYVEGTSSWAYDPSKDDTLFHSENEHFGESVSAWNKYVVVGSPMDSFSLSDKLFGYSALYKYDESQSLHRPIKKFYSPISPPGISQSIASDLDWYQYLQSIGYIESASIDGFGSSVSVSDNFMIVGAPLSKPCSDATGLAVVYYKYKGGLDNWGTTNVLQGESDGDKFGKAVCVDGNIIAVGAPGVSGSTGAVYVYRKWQYMGSGSYSVPTSSYLGNLVSVAGSVCQIVSDETGSLITTEDPTPTYVSGNYTWLLEAKLTSSWAVSGDRFGWTLDIDSNRLIVGSNTERAGFATLFVCSYTSSSLGAQPTASWTEYSTYQSNESLGDLPTSPIYATEVPVSFDGFGRTVAIDGDNLIIGCYYDKAFKAYSGSPDSSAVILGAAYFYRYQYDAECMTFDYQLINKSFGNREFVTNNNFARAVDVAGSRVVVSSDADQLIRSVDYVSGSFVLENQSYSASGSEDSVLGRVTIYKYDAVLKNWIVESEIKNNKIGGLPYYAFANSLSVTEDFLAVGAPIFNEAATSSYASIIDPSIQSSSNFPQSYAGAVSVYDFEELEVDPLVGNVFYKNGLVVMTNTSSNYEGLLTMTGSRGFEMKYQGTHTIFENECLVQVKPGEFNYSTNPSALIQNAQVFDVNQDGVFDIRDIDLIMKYLNKKRFSDSLDFADNGIELEQKTDNWWANNVLLTEAEDVLLLESDQTDQLAASAFVVYTKQIHDYINVNLVQTGILDIDGNGTIDLRDGNILLAYYLDKLTPTVLSSYIDVNSTRRYVKDVTAYLDRYTGNRKADIDPMFFGFQASSSYDPTGSYLAPYITTIGLYDESGELVAVSKLGRPIKNLIDWPINFVVRFDT